MRLRYFVLLVLIFSCSLIFSQSNKHNSWVIELDENVDYPLTEQELLFIKTAYNEEAFNRIITIKALKQNIKDILRNRVQILTKSYYLTESLPKLSSISNSNTPKIFNKNNFNPLLYDFDFESPKSQIYRVDGTGFIINIIPRKLK